MVECPSCHRNGKYIKFTLLFCRGWHGLLHKKPHGKHAYFSSDQSNFQFMALLLPFPSLMLKLRNSELQQPRRLRQMKRQVKINICTMVTILRLLLFARHSTVDKLRLKWTGRSAVKLNTGNERFTVGCSHCRQNYKFGNFTLSNHVKE